ncbi:MAG: ATP synthase subunit C [Planctomycetota bacterium]|jgi:V/A-type H+-transporting ATPase subunit K
MDKPSRKLKLQIIESVVVLFTMMAIIGTVFCTNAFAGEPNDPNVHATTATDMSTTKAAVMKFGLIAAAIAFGLGAIGAGIAISHVGAAAMGAVAEKPQIAGQALIFVALAEGLVVFGFITALMILAKI